jgi:hypothetical protein
VDEASCLVSAVDEASCLVSAGAPNEAGSLVHEINALRRSRYFPLRAVVFRERDERVVERPEVFRAAPA